MEKLVKKRFDFEELSEDLKRNFLERLWFIKYWAEYIKTHSDKDWSEQQKILIDAQVRQGADK